ncbi:MAG TPA: NAD-dependent epimerase/dehydratase family protein [Gemmatimonadaceae bacterium]|nr:NAD-dependent epimerase/dehydratase family protein [Gemmatimonadaceae bacterium]
MNVLVTGGAGFIGSNIVRLLLDGGHSVSVLDNLSSGHRQNLHPDAHFIEGDIRDADGVVDAAMDAEVIIHLAASVGNQRSLADPRADTAVNAIGTLNVLEAARSVGARKVVYSSSAGIFGELRTLPIAEEHPIEPDSPYGVSKLAGEKYCLAYSRLYDLEAICLRYFNVYGVNQRFDAYGNVIPIFATLLLRGQTLTVFGDGEQTRDFINVADVARANVLAACNHGVSGAFNLGSGTAVTINQLVRMLEDAAGKPATVQHGAPRRGDVRDSLADIRAVGRALGFAPTVALEPGLAEYTSWLRGELRLT